MLSSASSKLLRLIVRFCFWLFRATRLVSPRASSFDGLKKLRETETFALRSKSVRISYCGYEGCDGWGCESIVRIVSSTGI